MFSLRVTQSFSGDDCEPSGECTGDNQVCTDNKCACSPHYKDNGEGVCKTLKGTLQIHTAKS